MHFNYSLLITLYLLHLLFLVTHIQYGFHKIPHMQQGMMNSSEHEVWEFSNAHFQRAHPDLLALVERKKAKPDEERTGDTLNQDISHLSSDISAIKRNQSTICVDLRKVQHENQMLWQESVAIRSRYQKQQETGRNTNFDFFDYYSE